MSGLMKKYGRLFAVLAAVALGASVARAEQLGVRPVRNLSGVQGGITNPEGVAWLPGSGRFLVMQAAADEVKLGVLEALGEPAGTMTLAARRVRPENVAFDAKRSRLVMLDDVSSALIVAELSAEGVIEPASVRRIAAPALGPVRAAGIAIDASTGTMYVLDRLSRRIAVVPEGLWNGGAAEGERTGWIDLDAIEAADLRGLGWDAAGERWFVLDAATTTLIAVNGGGEEAGRWELDGAELASPRGLMVAPTGDPTDDPARISVYIADAGTPQRAGYVVEFKFRTELPLQVAATVAGTLVRTVNTATWSPPSPDPSGIAYDKVQNRLLVSDGEVEEMSLYRGANYYECSLSGALLRSSNTLRFSTEPVGVAFDTPSRIIISDDVAKKVFLVNVGSDGHVGGSDDTWTSFTAPGSDPEGASYDKAGNRLFVADGLGEEVWVVRAGSDGNLGTSDDQVTHFDTSTLGVTDPECMEYNPTAGSLYIIGSNDKLVETSVTGSLLNTITTSGISTRKPAGMALAPHSTNASLSSLYICDRGVDNDSNPSENDGKIFEITASILGSNPGGGGGGGDPIPPGASDFTIAAGSDDAEQGGTSVSVNGSDLELVTDGSTVQTVGLRFTGVSIPKNAVISSAWIQFTADESQTESTALRIEGQAADNPATFTSASSNISSRPRTTQFVNWSLVPWGSSDGAGINQKTPSLTPIVQALVNRTGWASGNAMAFIITGSGHRTAESFEAGADKAAILHIEMVVPNVKPSVNAGVDQTITLPASATLAGTVSDDGLPNSGTLTRLWTQQSGPLGGTVTFANENLANTQASFSVAGTYILRLTASDGELTEFDEMQVIVNPEPVGGGGGGGSTAFPVKAGSDDAEQSGSSVAVTGSDLELITDGSKVQTVGVRFTGITVPKNAVIANAWIQFHADEAQTVATALRIEGQAADNPLTFTSASSNISSRPRTTQFVNWNPVAWGSSDGAGANQKTSSLTTIVQALVNRSGWASGNAMAFIITGTGHRTADSYEGGAAKAPVLHIEIGTGTQVNVKPTVSAGPDRVIVLPASAALDGTVSDDGLPAGTLTTEWTMQSGPGTGTVTFVDPFAVDTQASFTEAGLYVLRLTANDGELQEFAEMQVSAGLSVGGGGGGGGTPVTLDKRVAAGADDAEQAATGATSLNSSDLELVFDGSNQFIGVRFSGITIPRNATITNAWIQFTRDEAQSEATSLTIAGQANDNALAFVKATNNISARPRTTATVAWNPAAWVSGDLAGPNQKTESLTSIVQEIVNRTGWTSGNAMAFVITGTGRRTAEAYEGSASSAALLHVEYTP